MKLVGRDACDQLEPVGSMTTWRPFWSRVLGIGSNAVPVVRLTEVCRQAAQSRIIMNAYRINRGPSRNLTLEEGSDFYFDDAADPEDRLRKLLAVVRDRMPARF